DRFARTSTGTAPYASSVPLRYRAPARAASSGVQPPSPDFFSASSTDATTLLARPKHDDWASVAATATTHAALPAITPAVGAAPFARSVAHQVSAGRLTLARKSSADAAPARAGPLSARGEEAMAHTAEIPVAAATPVPMIWRAAEDTGARERSARSADAGS